MAIQLSEACDLSIPCRKRWSLHGCHAGQMEASRHWLDGGELKMVEFSLLVEADILTVVTVALAKEPEVNIALAGVQGQLGPCM